MRTNTFAEIIIIIVDINNLIVFLPEDCGRLVSRLVQNYCSCTAVFVVVAGPAADGTYIVVVAAIRSNRHTVKD